MITFPCIVYLQEPYEWPSVAAISRKVLSLRYELLPYYYTLFYKASRPVTSTPSATVTRPLFFEFPNDTKTYSIDRQFMVGSGLLISPVLEQGQLINTCGILYIGNHLQKKSFVNYLHCHSS